MEFSVDIALDDGGALFAELEAVSAEEALTKLATLLEECRPVRYSFWTHPLARHEKTEARGAAASPHGPRPTRSRSDD